MSRQASKGGTSGSGPSSAGSSLAEWAHWTRPKPGSYSCRGRPAVQLSLSFWLEEASAREPAPLSRPGRNRDLPTPAGGGRKPVPGSAGASHRLYVNAGPPRAGAQPVPWAWPTA